MDPQLWEELARGEATAEIRAIVRLLPGATAPSGMRVISRFGDIVTCRLRRDAIVATRQHPSVRSLKAARSLETVNRYGRPTASAPRGGDRRRPQVSETGRGVIVGVVDYGCDFAHHAFRTAQGGSRIKSLWHQAGHRDQTRIPDPFDQGRVWNTDDINSALRRRDPYRALGYHPSRRGADGNRSPSHGTHVAAIATGGPTYDGPTGMAPDAELVFVHVANENTSGRLNFGDSVGVLEAVDFINRTAGDQAAAINISLGRHGGPHDGTTLIEQAFDHLLMNRPGLSIVQSAGNYYGRKIHCEGLLRPNQPGLMAWRVHPQAGGTKELEIWIAQDDSVDIEIIAPDGTRWDVPAGARVPLEKDGVLLGRAYHRLDDPGNGDTHVDVFIYDETGASWVLRAQVAPRKIRDGRWHAWLERHGSPRYQTRFVSGPISNASTAGTIANGRGAIQVAAHTRRAPHRITSFSSAGPARDGRSVPMIAAPGEAVVSARSATGGDSHREVYATSGTSMAAPHVTGTVALMLQAAPALTQKHIRAILRTTALPIAGDPTRDGIRATWGRLDPVAAVRAARRLGAQTRQAPTEQTLPHITSAEWTVIRNWSLRGFAPNDGTGAFARGITPRNAVPLPPVAVDAARVVAAALLNMRQRALGPARPLPTRSMMTSSRLDPIARQVVAAMPLSRADWAVVAAFIEAQTDRIRTIPAPDRPLISASDTTNRRTIAHHVACARETQFPGQTGRPAICTIPHTGPVVASIAILMQHLRSLGPIRNWPEVGMDARRVYIMERLVSHHGYPVNTAAGIVGNLDSESGLIPERVEGSRPATPRTAAAMRGNRRRFSAADIMNRSRSAGVGPRRPGIGLAQWTSSGRRRTFFAHRYKDVQLGARIVFFMDPQIDALVTELQTSYRRLERSLRNANTSRDQAADDFVYDYERPGSILEPRTDDPTRMRRSARTSDNVQEVFRHRRDRARRAYDAYRAVHPVRTPVPAQ